MTCCTKMEEYQSFVRGEADLASVSEDGDCGGFVYMWNDSILFSNGFKSIEVKLAFCPFCGTKQEKQDD